MSRPLTPQEKLYYLLMGAMWAPPLWALLFAVLSLQPIVPGQ